MHITYFFIIGIFALCFECMQSKSILSDPRPRLHKPRTLESFITCLRNCGSKLSKENSLTSHLYKRKFLPLLSPKQSPGSDLDQDKQESHQDKSDIDRKKRDADGSSSSSSSSSETSRSSASSRSDSESMPSHGSWYCHDLCWKTSNVFGQIKAFG